MSILECVFLESFKLAELESDMPFEPNTDIAHLLGDDTRAERTDATPFDFKALVEGAGVGISQAEIGTGRILYTNAAFCQMVGYTAAELTNGAITFLELMHPGDRGKNIADHRLLLEGKISRYTIDKRYLHKNGNIVWGRTTATALRDADGKLRWTVGIIRDITQEKLLERKLEVAEELCGIATWNRAMDNSKSSGSASYNALYGYPPEAPYPTIKEFIARIHPDDRDAATIALQSALNGEAYKDEFRIVRPNGDVRHFKTAAMAIRNASGEITNFIGATVDVTEFKTLEADLREATAAGHLRNVEDYIEANLAQTLTIETLASVLNVSERSIFRYFKQARDCTPMEFVKSLRLRTAQRMLQQPEAGASVAAIAYKCGFHNLGHFAKDYRIAFGELPSETLTKGRRLAS